MTYRMTNCQVLISEYGASLGLIKTLVDDIERAASQNSNAIFCLAYSLIDTVCKTIQDGRGSEASNNDDLPKRFKATLKLLSLVPEDYDGAGREGIAQAMRGLEQTVRGLCELRNSDGIYSHGKVATKPHYDMLQIRLALESTDTIVNYLYRAHLDYPVPNPQLIYEDQKEFNDAIDETYGSIEIAGQAFLPSRILYSYDSDQTTYREALEEFKLQQELDKEP